MKKIFKSDTGRSLFDKHKKVLVVVSGGLDSMNLFHLLNEYSKELELNFDLPMSTMDKERNLLLRKKYLKQLAKRL